MRTRPTRRRLLGAALPALSVLLGLLLVVPASGRASGHPAVRDVLAKAAPWSERFEAMMKRASFTVSGDLESLAGDGSVDERLEGVFRFQPRGSYHHVEVVRYTEDGEDETEKAREDAAEREEKRREDPPDPDEQAHLPFLSAEQPKYVFRVVEVDHRDPARVRVHFTPKRPAKNLPVGSAWIDTRTGAVLTMGASPSELDTFVDYLRVTMEFGASTPVVNAVSKVRFEGQASFLFLRRRFRGSAVLVDYSVK
jgi:hypothetical protein